MPGFEEDVAYPAYLDPPRPDADETLPSQVHPSYPFGRPKVGSKLGLTGPNAHGGASVSKQAGNLLLPNEREDVWTEMDMGAVLEKPDGKEVPPVMAVCRRCRIDAGADDRARSDLRLQARRCCGQDICRPHALLISDTT